MQILKTIDGYAEYVILIVVLCVLSMIAHALTSHEPPRSRTKSILANGADVDNMVYNTNSCISS